MQKCQGYIILLFNMVGGFVDGAGVGMDGSGVKDAQKSLLETFKWST